MTDKQRLNDLNTYIRQGKPEQAEIHPFRDGNVTLRHQQKAA